MKTSPDSTITKIGATEKIYDLPLLALATIKLKNLLKNVEKAIKVNETEFLLFKKLVELLRSHEARIRQLEEQVGSPTDESEEVEKLNQLIRELPGVHFPVPNRDL